MSHDLIVITLCCITQFTISIPEHPWYVTSLLVITFIILRHKIKDTDILKAFGCNATYKWLKNVRRAHQLFYRQRKTQNQIQITSTGCDTQDNRRIKRKCKHHATMNTSTRTLSSLSKLRSIIQRGYSNTKLYTNIYWYMYFSRNV